MNPFVMHFCSGNSFYSGSLILIIGIALSFIKSKSIFLKAVVNLIILNGMIIMFLSSVFIFKIYFSLLVFITLVFILINSFTEKVPDFVLNIFRVLIALFVLIGLLFEIPHYFMPSLPKKKFDKIFALGDSISGGIGYKGERTWWQVFENKYGIKADCRAYGGAQIEGVIPMARKITEEKCFILLEIGGNDILRAKSSQKFERDLDKLLAIVSGPGRVIAMFGLPVPPLRDDYVEIQQRLSEKYGVILVPRRYFARILTGDDYSEDGLHLNNKGHERMADIVWELFGEILVNDRD